MRIHSVHKLIQHRKAISTKPFQARGAKVNRCEYCQIDRKFCTCSVQPDIKTNVAVPIIMSNNEVLKPSNTGRLIADVVKETYCCEWARTEPDEDLLRLIDSPDYFPVVVFPEDYVKDKSRLHISPETTPEQVLAKETKRKPLFIFLDGSWREARRIFNKSPYLDKLPVLSIQPENLSAYLMRRSENDNHLSTAEVASIVLDMYGEKRASEILALWFEVFRESYLLSKTRLKPDFSRPAYMALYRLKI